MKEGNMSVSFFNPVSLGLGILAGLLVFAVLTGIKIPVITGERAALIAFIVIGMAICTRSGIGRVAATGQWAHPLAIIAYLIGAAILIIGIGMALGVRLPFIANSRQALIAISALAATKVVLGMIHRLL